MILVSEMQKIYFTVCFVFCECFNMQSQKKEDKRQRVRKLYLTLRNRSMENPEDYVVFLCSYCLVECTLSYLCEKLLLLITFS